MDENRGNTEVELFKAYTVEEIEEHRELFGFSFFDDVLESWSPGGSD